MADNIYTGPGWYWVEGWEEPAYLGMSLMNVLSVYHRTQWWDHISGKPIKPIARIEKPEPRPTMDWSVLPAWAKWIACAGGDTWYWYIEAPMRCEAFFRSIHPDDFGIIPREYAPKWNGDWRNSLVEVPR